jgi:hypothetical protein
MGVTTYITSDGFLACVHASEGLSAPPTKAAGFFGLLPMATISVRRWRVFPAMIAATLVQATSLLANEPTPPASGPLGDKMVDFASQNDKTIALAKEAEFVLSEVRKLLDPNPETEIVDLKIDPEYRGSQNIDLVNAVLDAKGRKLTVGVIVAVTRTPSGLKATIGYID